MTEFTDNEFHQLLKVFERGKSLGFLGPVSIQDHIDHADRFIQACPVEVGRAIDLGSGAGVPGLVLALRWPKSRWWLLDASHKRTEFLFWAVLNLDLEARVSVLRGRAEELGRESYLRESFDLVTARGFSIPSVTAECGSPFLKVGGVLLVSEPPEPTPRWPVYGVKQLGLSLVSATGSSIAVLEKTQPLSEKYPRRVGVPNKRPLF